MKASLIASVAILSALCITAGCGHSPANSTITDITESSTKGLKEGEKYLLGEEPTAAVGVLKFKDDSHDGDVVQVRGRIGGGLKPWIEGRAAFILVDEDVDVACNGDLCEPDCPHCKAELTRASTVVKFVDERGQPLPVDSRKLLGVRNMQPVVVQGLAKRDTAGNVTIVAEGIFLRR